MREVNFFREYHGKEKDQNNTLVYLLLASIIIFIGYTYISSEIQIKQIKNNKTTLEQKINDPEMESQIELSDEVNQKLDILSQVEESLSQINQAVESRDIVTVNLLNQLSSTLPSEVSFKNLVISDGSIVMSAVSTSRTAIAEVQHNLKELPQIDSVYIGAISEMGGLEGQYSFDLRCVLKGGK